MGNQFIFGTVQNNNFDNFIIDKHHEGVHVESSGQDDAILRELQEIQQTLKETEPLVARMVGELCDAIKADDKPKISDRIKDLTTGFAKSVISGVASAALKHFLFRS